MRRACEAFFLLLLLAAPLLLGACANERRLEPRRADPATPAPTPEQPTEPEPDANDELALLRVEGQELRLEVAADWESRGRGLSGRTSLPEDGGMIFVYEMSESRSFWMKDCRMGLDIAFLDEQGRIISVTSLDPPAPGTTDADMPRARCAGGARFVVETRKGWFAARGVQAGDVFELPGKILELAGLERDS